MTALWTSAEAAAATGGQNTRDWRATGVSIDTRTLQPGDLFVALQAARDGHDFVAQALAQGAAAALVSRIPEGVAEDAPLLVVPDVLNALEALGRAGRARTAARVLAVTGSVGKTSTKEMLRAILSGQGRTHASVASYNNHWGVPLTLARMPQETEFAVIEIGMNHPGEIAPLAAMARPHVALITTVAAAHLAAFEGIEGIAREKASILTGLEPGGAAVLNADIETAPILAEVAAATGARARWFGEKGADLRLEAVHLHDDVTVAEAREGDNPRLLKIRAVGRHFAMNALGALLAAETLGADPGLATTDLGNWQPVTGRGARERVVLDAVDRHIAIDLIDDAYNANPASVAAALEVLATAETHNDLGRVSRGRRILYLGDMKELGAGEVAAHRALAEHPAMAQIDRVHVAGPLMAELHAALPERQQGRACADAVTLAQDIRQDLDAGDVVLVKGSLSMGLARVVDAIRKMGDSASQTDPGEN